MGTKVKELDNIKQGDRANCPICNPSRRMVTENQVWAWQQANPDESPWVESTPTP